jgi:hypothetical protein
MASEEQRRRAGAAGAGTASESEQLPDGQKPEKEKKKAPDDVAKVLKPDTLEFAITRDVIAVAGEPSVNKAFTLVVPTQFTLGDLIQREVSQDFDAYVRLVMVELGEVSSIDVRANPTLMFSRENMAYLDVVLGASNVRRFMARILAKSAYVLDPEVVEQPRLAVRASDVDQLSYTQVLTIGAHYVNRWLDRWLEARKSEKAAGEAKNASRAAQT